jgi:hypothetical protein
MIRKWLAIGIILLFVLIAVNPITGFSDNRDDTTPPVTTISLNPPEPNGLNNWYVSKVTVNLNAIDNESGVKITECQLDYGSWWTYLQPFNITTDNYHILKYRSIDNAGNTEPTKNITCAIDCTKPQIEFWYNLTGDAWSGVTCTFIAQAEDAMSGMNRTEFYLNDILYETVKGSGPLYKMIYRFFYTDRYNVKGFIANPKYTNDSVSFYSLFVFVYVVGKYNASLIPIARAYDNAGNMEFDGIYIPLYPASVLPGLYLFRHMTFPHNYTGYIGRYFVRAIFYYR